MGGLWRKGTWGEHHAALGGPGGPTRITPHLHPHSGLRCLLPSATSRTWDAVKTCGPPRSAAAGPQSGQEGLSCFMTFEGGRPQTAAAELGRRAHQKRPRKDRAAADWHASCVDLSSCHLVGPATFILRAGKMEPDGRCARWWTGARAPPGRPVAGGSAGGLSNRERKGGTPRSGKMPGPAPYGMPGNLRLPRTTGPRGAGRREGAPGGGERDFGSSRVRVGG